MAKCTSIVKLDSIIGAGDVLQVTIDNTTTAYWIYDYAEAMKFVDQEVIVEYRKDIYKGNLEQFIATFTVPTMVTTLDKKENIKLFIDQVDNISNVAFREIEDGDDRLGCIVFCTQSCFKSSQKATWMELIIRDSTMHTATLRLFDYENKDVDYSGKYIKTNLKRNQYGFQSELIKPLDEGVYVNPEIELAKNFIKNYFINDPVAIAYMEKTNVLQFIEEDVDYEKGYGLMRLAMELSMVDSMQNITKDVDLTAIGQALLLSHGWRTHASIMSHSFTNATIGWSCMFPNRRTVLRLLDDCLEDKPIEYSVMCSIKETVDTILKVRKGTIE